MGEQPVLVAGEALMDVFPDGNEDLAAAERLRHRPGGAPANVAVALAALGTPTRLWARVGDDPFGDRIVDTLTSHGLATRFLEQDPAAPTTLALVDPSRDTFQFYRTGCADVRLGVDGEPPGLLDGIELAVFGGVALAERSLRERITRVMTRCADRGNTVIFDPNYREVLWSEDRFRRVVGERLSAIDVLTATAAELITIANAVDERTAAERIHERGCSTILVTAGAEGARLYADEESPFGPVRTSHPGYRVEAIDPVGAGDAFTAGIAAELAAGQTDPEAALAIANAAGALATTGQGAMATAPTMAQVETLIEDQSHV